MLFRADKVVYHRPTRLTTQTRYGQRRGGKNPTKHDEYKMYWTYEEDYSRVMLKVAKIQLHTCTTNSR